MIIGFTGTQKGMSDYQKSVLRARLSNIKNTNQGNEFHHGDCIGADAEAHIIAKLLGYRIIIHPPINGIKRAFCDGDLILPEKDYLARNQDIVEACDFLIACPISLKEEVRSGTWYTIRFARRREKKLIILGP
jgi:hypothetical protein